jgi:hypothetical protein
MNELSSQSFGAGSAFFNRDNALQNYVKGLETGAVERLSQPSQDVAQLMNQNLVGLLGALPSAQFNMMVTTTREDLGQLMASAMMYGYFLHGAEQRMNFDQSLSSDHPAEE